MDKLQVLVLTTSEMFNFFRQRIPYVIVGIYQGREGLVFVVEVVYCQEIIEVLSTCIRIKQ